MRIGDIVELKDGSYNMSLVKGKLKHIFGVYGQWRRFRVLGLSGVYPAYNHNLGLGGGKKINNTMLVDINDPDFVLFTQKRFCNVVTPSSESKQPSQLEIVIPRGTEEVHLILQ